MELQALALAPEDRQIFGSLWSSSDQIFGSLWSSSDQIFGSLWSSSDQDVSVNHDKLGLWEDLMPPKVCNSLINENGDNIQKGVDDNSDLMITWWYR